MVVFGWGLTQLAKFTFQRTRPAHALDLLTSTGYAYPSSHMCSVVAGAIAVGATFAVTRQTVRAQAVWQVGAGLLVLLVGSTAGSSARTTSPTSSAARCSAPRSHRASLIASGVKVPAPYELVTELVRSKAVDPRPGLRCAPR